MRKFLLLLSVALLGLSATAEQVTITPDAETYTGNGFELTTAKNSGSTNPLFSSDGDLRIYAKGSVTIATTVSGITIDKIVFNLSTQGLQRLAPITASVGSIATQTKGDKTVTWTGSSNSVTFTVGEKATYGSESTKAGQLCFTSITIDYTSTGGAVILKEAELAFPESNYTAKIGEDFTEPTLSKATDADATYVSSNPLVATVDATTGTITPLSEGETTITATTEATESYKAGEASYTLTVIDPSKVRYEDFLTIDSFSNISSGYKVDSYTSTSTNVKYTVKANKNNGIQINTDARSSKSATKSGLISVSNPDNLIIKKIVVICSEANGSNLALDVSNQPGTATADGTTGSTSYVEGATDGVTVTGVLSADKKEVTFTPEGDYHYFYLHTTANTVVTDVQVYYEALPGVATATIGEKEVSESYQLEGAEVTVVLTAPKGESIWYKFTAATSSEAAQAAEAGFAEYPAEGIKIGQQGTLQYYTELNGRQSAITSIEFTGTPASISEITADDAAAEWYDLSGRRVASPAKGVFIKKTGSKVSKYVF